jgi:hypothetical protein
MILSAIVDVEQYNCKLEVYPMEKIPLTIRATNGAAWETSNFGENDKVDVVRKAGLRHFVDAGVMTAGDYLLALVSDGHATELADSSSLEDAGVEEGAILALLVRGPQVDG